MARISGTVQPAVAGGAAVLQQQHVALALAGVERDDHRVGDRGEAHGDDDSDGLSASQPFATFQAAFDALKNYGPMLIGSWSIVAAAGIYTIDSGQETFSVPSLIRVVIRGPSVGGHPNVPTCLVDGGGDETSYNHGLSASGVGVKVEFRDIKTQNFTEAAGTTRIGIVGENEADVLTTNVHTEDCSWTGIYGFSTLRMRIGGGIHDGNTDGLTVNDTQTTIGYGATQLSEGPIVRNSTQRGVYVSRGSQGHVDYVTFEDNGVGLVIAENSRIDYVGNDFKSNTVAIRAETGGIADDGGGNEFNRGTGDANTTDLDYRAYAGHGDLRNEYSEVRIARDRTSYSHVPGTTSKQVVSTPLTLPAYRLVTVDQCLRVVVHGLMTSVTAASTIHLDFGGSAGQSLGVIGTPGAGVAFEVEFKVYPSSATGQRIMGKLIQGAASSRAGNAGSSIDFTSAQAVQIAWTAANDADTLTINRVDVFLVG